MIKILTEANIRKAKEDAENTLLTSSKIKFSFDRRWSHNFLSQAGVYAIFDKGTLCYIGQTANLRERMKEVKRTYNHSFRKKLGYTLGGVIEKRKFSESIEEELNEYFKNNLTFSALAIDFGRLEIESYLIQKSDDDLLNSRQRRMSRKTEKNKA